MPANKPPGARGWQWTNPVHFAEIQLLTKRRAPTGFAHDLTGHGQSRSSIEYSSRMSMRSPVPRRPHGRGNVIKDETPRLCVPDGPRLGANVLAKRHRHRRPRGQGTCAANSQALPFQSTLTSLCPPGTAVVRQTRSCELPDPMRKRCETLLQPSTAPPKFLFQDI